MSAEPSGRSSRSTGLTRAKVPATRVPNGGSSERAAIGLAVLAGLAGSVQVAVMGRFGARIGVVEALDVRDRRPARARGAICSSRGRAPAGSRRASAAPPWMWAGGVMGLLIVFTVTFAQPRIGATATIGILIAGQLVMGAVIDRFGLLRGRPDRDLVAAGGRDRAARRRRGAVALEDCALK